MKKWRSPRSWKIFKHFTRKINLPSWRKRTSFPSCPQLSPDLPTATNNRSNVKITTSKSIITPWWGAAYVNTRERSSLSTCVKCPWISLQPRMSFAFLSPICCRPFSSLREPELRTCRIFCLDVSSTDVSRWDSQSFSSMFSLPSGGWERNDKYRWGRHLFF